MSVKKVNHLLNFYKLSFNSAADTFYYFSHRNFSKSPVPIVIAAEQELGDINQPLYSTAGHSQQLLGKLSIIYLKERKTNIIILNRILYRNILTPKSQYL